MAGPPMLSPLVVPSAPGESVPHRKCGHTAYGQDGPLPLPGEASSAVAPARSTYTLCRLFTRPPACDRTDGVCMPSVCAGQASQDTRASLTSGLLLLAFSRTCRAGVRQEAGACSTHAHGPRGPVDAGPPLRLHVDGRGDPGHLADDTGGMAVPGEVFRHIHVARSQTADSAVSQADFRLPSQGDNI